MKTALFVKDTHQFPSAAFYSPEYFYSSDTVSLEPQEQMLIVLDENDTVIYSQLVPEIADEPDYDAALAALN